MSLSLPKIPRKRLIVSSLIVVMVIIIAFFKKPSQPQDTLIYTGRPVAVATGAIQETLSFDGTTQFVSSQKLTFGQQNLRVNSVNVELGDQVQAGQILAVLDTSAINANFRVAQSALQLAQLNYDQVANAANHEVDLLNAQKSLSEAQSKLDNIEVTIQIDNANEDNALAKAQQTLVDAQKRYDDLTCEGCGKANKDIRDKENTFSNARETLRQSYFSLQDSLDSIDKIMYFSDKYRLPGDEASPYIGANNPTSVATVSTDFFKLKNKLESEMINFANLETIPSSQLTTQQLEKAYSGLATLTQLALSLGSDARTMFNQTLVGRAMAGAGAPMTQQQVDSYITLAEGIYNTAKSLQSQGQATMEQVYAIDDLGNESSINKALQALNDAKIAVDKLKVAQSNRTTTNQSQRIEAYNAVQQAQSQLNAVKGGYGNTNVANAKNQLTQAQSNFTTARQQYENYELIANFGGKITDMNIQVGDLVNATSNTYIYVENTNLVEVSFDLDQVDILKIKKGDPVNIVIDTYADQTFSGIISEITTVPTIVNNVASYQAKAMFEKPEDTTILGGMSATVSFTYQQKDNVLMVPNSSISFRNGKSFVTLANGTQQEISIGLSDQLHTEVVSGLKAGDRILSIVVSTEDLKNSGVSDSFSPEIASPAQNKIRQDAKNNP